MSKLKKANTLLRDGRYREARKLYLEVVSKTPILKNTIQFNIDLIDKKIRETPILPNLEEIQKLPITALVITWEIGHNPLGRSYMLAEAMQKSVENVILTGFQFPLFGDDTWEPVREGNLAVISMPGKNFPELLDSFESIVERFKPDIVVACKARIPSVELGIIFKKKYNIPLIIDVDDYELSFFENEQPISINQLKAMPREDILKETEPYSETWTRVAESLCKYADETIVSNIALQKKFGGTILPHVRDEETFDTSLFDKRKEREKYNIPLYAKVVMFFGTPRKHKGINVLAQAVGKIQDNSYLLVIIGDAPDKNVFNEVGSLSKGKVLYLPNQPFSAIPEIIVMADIVCLPQDEEDSISKHQLPAKAIDAIGMGIPLLVSNTEPLMQLVNNGVATLIDNEDLSIVIQRELERNSTKSEKVELRKKFLTNYSYHSAALSMKEVIQKAINNKRTSLDGFDELLEYQQEVYRPR